MAAHLQRAVPPLLGQLEKNLLYVFDLFFNKDLPNKCAARFGDT